MRCLLVEDQDYILEMLTDRISSTFKSIDVVAVESGNKAISILKLDKGFDFIISDQNMPDGFGTDVLNFMKLNDIQIPFALYTSMPDEDVGKHPHYFLGRFHKDQFKQMADVITERLSVK